MIANDVMSQKANVFVLAIETAWSAIICEDEKVPIAARLAPGTTVCRQSLQTLLLNNRWPSRVLPRKKHNDAGICSAPICGNKWA